MGLLFAALVAHNMNWRGALKLVTPLVILALLSIPLSYRLLHADIMLPGLLFIGFGVFATNTRYFKFSREEKAALGWAGLFVAALTVGLYFAAPTIVHLAQQGEPAAQHGTSAPQSGGKAIDQTAQPTRSARPTHNMTPSMPGEGG
jgi:hypothetical protein